jgi:SAM-dependent methyltransferase
MRRTYQALYRLGLLPWESTEVPAPLVEFVAAAATPGTAVDLGCGTGRQALYLAGHGWTVTGVDFTPQAILQARRADPAARVTWRVADVTSSAEVDPAGALAGGCDLVLDNGCLHGLPVTARSGWAATVGHLAAAGATLLLRAAPARHGPRVGPRGIDQSTVDELLAGWTGSAIGGGWYRYRR